MSNTIGTEGAEEALGLIRDRIPNYRYSDFGMSIF
jgi:hypothetical protein